MVSIQEAAKKAIDFANQLELAGFSGAKLRLEEVESGDEDGQAVWKITLSVTEPDEFTKAHNSLANIIGTQPKLQGREYKVFTVLKNTGDVLSMKMRSPVAQ